MCNSRRHCFLWCNSLTILICLLCSGLVGTNAAVHYYHILGSEGDGSSILRLTRDVSAKLTLQEQPKEIGSTAEPAPSVVNQPQGHCLLDGVLVIETAVTCEKQVGCRAIQKTGHCCPDYKCDCQKDGRTYLNGDKLVYPETPCTVCYCQGGEILCSSVTCFHRDDCKPKYIPGRCCPEYDNCPVSIFDPSNNGNQSHSPPPATEETNVTIASPNQPIQQTVPEKPKITIKEITKPIEIRITDDNKVIPIHQMIKPQTSTTPQITTTTESTSTSTRLAENSVFMKLRTTAPTASVATILPSTRLITTDVDYSISGENILKVTLTGSDINTDSNSSFAIDNNRQTLLPVNGGINNTESLKLSTSVAYPSTERNTVKIVVPQNGANVEYNNNDNNGVTAVVAQLNEEDSVIAEFGAQELQHVASFNDPTKINIKRENLATTEQSPSAVPLEEYGSSQLSDGNESEQSGGLQSQSNFDFEPETAGSDNVYHIILTTTGPHIDRTTDGFLSVKASEDFQPPSDYDMQGYASNSQHVVVSPPPQLLNFTHSPLTLKSTTQEPTTNSSSTSNNKLISSEGIVLSSISTESPKHTSEFSHHVEEEDIALPMESNPAYPSLPEDDFSLRDVNFPINEADDAMEADVKEEQRSIGSIAFEVVRSRKPIEEGSGSGVEFMEASTPAYEACVDCTAEKLSKLSTKVALLMNSAEDLSVEISISNNTDFISDRFSRLANNSTNSFSKESIETQMSSEMGSGESMEMEQMLEKRREPTTPRPTPRSEIAIDIDELSGNTSGDGQSDPKEDPKLDAESIKADENVEDGIVKQEAGLKEDVLTVNAKPTEERTVEEIPMNSKVARIQQLIQRRFV